MAKNGHQGSGAQAPAKVEVERLSQAKCCGQNALAVKKCQDSKFIARK
jgi:hypothetical protein